jgi:hypothetical protein
MAAKSSNQKGLSTGAKVAIGVAGLAVIMVLGSGEPDEDDAWVADGKEVDDVGSADPNDVDLDLDDDDDEVAIPADDPWTRGPPPPDDDDEPELPADDPWTRGPPPPDDDDDEPELPADDPWTRGSDDDGGFGDDGLPACVGVLEFQTSDGAVVLPIDQTDDAFASPDCAIPEGRSGDAVALVQTALTFCNDQPVALDGVYGATVTDAVAAVQSRSGLTEDGVYGPSTREAMAWPTVPDGGGAAVCVSHPDVG